MWWMYTSPPLRVFYLCAGPVICFLMWWMYTSPPLRVFYLCAGTVIWCLLYLHRGIHQKDGRGYSIDNLVSVLQPLDHVVNDILLFIFDEYQLPENTSDGTIMRLGVNSLGRNLDDRHRRWWTWSSLSMTCCDAHHDMTCVTLLASSSSSVAFESCSSRLGLFIANTAGGI